MSHKPQASETSGYVELRTGTPCAHLIRDQVRFAEFVGDRFGIRGDHVIPTAGTTGAIEAVRNHVLRTSNRKHPVVVTVRPGYWRARQAFEGMGFAIEEVKTEVDGFAINESRIIQRIKEIGADMLYLSFPNNPTGAVFDPDLFINGVSDDTAIVFDMTLPRPDVHLPRLINQLFEGFEGRKNLYLIGSTSKSHGTAKHRIGWAICTSKDDAEALRMENRNVVSCFAIDEGMRHVGSKPTVLMGIEKSFALLRKAESSETFKIMRPRRRVSTSYVLLRLQEPVEIVKKRLDEERIVVMWGSDFGLSDEYLRLETMEPSAIEVFIEAMTRGYGRPLILTDFEQTIPTHV